MPALGLRLSGTLPMTVVDRVEGVDGREAAVLYMSRRE
jgi:hypothetical protein